ncbi:hypothetical protein [Enterococcus sp. DIV0756]|uniref:hypothetical protein n=1 Tax=Enterococcus sp. DIV0756 TaxID=2774636 RepID=UPI003F25289D
MRKYKKRFGLFFLSVMLLFSNISPEVVTAVMDLTTQSNEVATSNSDSEGTSSETSTEPITSQNQEGQPAVEDIVAENDYEERELSDEITGNSPHPIVQAVKDSEAKLVVQNENQQQITRLEKMILQSKQGENWQNKEEHHIDKNQEIREIPYSFKYDVDTLSRIVVEYTVSEFEDGYIRKRTKHKAHYRLKGTKSEEADTSNKTKESQKESSQNNTDIPSAETNDSLIRTSRGIMPLGANINYSGGYTPSTSTGEAGIQSKLTISGIGKTSATISGQHYRTGEIRAPIYIVWSKQSNGFGAPISPSDMTNLTTKKQMNFSSNGEKRAMYFDVTLNNLEAGQTYYFWMYTKTLFSADYTKFGTDKSDDTGVNTEGYWRYHFTTDSVVNLTVEAPKFLSTKHNSATLGTSYYTGDISANDSDGILKMSGNSSSTLTNKATNIVHETICGTSNAKGKVNNVSNGRTFTGLTAGTKYKAQLSIRDFGTTGAGTNWVNSPETTIYTTNTVSSLSLTENIRPPLGNVKASAVFEGSYGYNSNSTLAAHPKPTINEALHVKVKETSTNDWGNYLTTTSTPGVEKIQCSNGKVKFKVTGLSPKKEYNVAYHVTNNGGNSEWGFLPDANKSFTTYATTMSINTPQITTENATSAKLKTGNFSGDSSRAELLVEKFTGGTSWTGVTNSAYANVPKTTTQYATPSGFNFGGLLAGNKYRSRVKMYYNDSSNGSILSGYSNDYVTPNTVSNPAVTPGSVPSSITNASATVVGEYQAGTEHPKGSGVTEGVSGKGVQIELKSPTDSGFIAAGDKASDVQINSTGSIPNISFKLSNLLSATRYSVRYRVKNNSGLWSNWGTSIFNTRGVPLKLSPPIFEEAEPTSIKMRSGSYTGDIDPVLNRGIIQTESYNVQNGSQTDKISKVTDLAHNPVEKTYEERIVTDLDPGTRYQGWCAFKDYGSDGTDGTYQYKANDQQVYFYTTNKISNLTEPVKEMPTTTNNAKATFVGTYEAAERHEAQVAAHPTKVKVFLKTDNSNFQEVTTSSEGPRLSSDNDIDSNQKKITFKLEGLLENTHYHVKYQVVNQGGDSPISDSYEFTTLARSNGFYINQVPEAFNFGTIDLSENEMSHPLQNTNTGDYFVDFENININEQWSLSAKLSKLQVEGEQWTLTGSKIVMDKQLKKTGDNGVTWNTADSNRFDSVLGINGSFNLPADGSTSIPLFETTDSQYGIGHFKNEISTDSVRLIIPRNTGKKGKTYEGTLTWTMDLLEP